MSTLFGADGIRGIIDRYPLRIEDVERLGRVVATWLRESTGSPAFLIGTDTRESSQRLKVALSNGLARAGVHVVDAGILPTAAVSYLIAQKGVFAAGAMISASHNPIAENGVKFFDHRGVKINDQVEALLEELFFGNPSLPIESRPSSIVFEPDYAIHYGRALAREFIEYDWHGCRLVLDCANGAIYRIAQYVLNLLRVPHILINANPDGTNINRFAGTEYFRRNPHQLADEIRKYGAVVGVTLDGDADRALFVEENGRVYDGDMSLAILGLKLHREHHLRQDSVVITQMSNSALPEFFRSQRIRTITVRNGDKYVTEAILEKDLTLGGEEVGHTIYHTDHTHVTGDGLRTMLLLVGELTHHRGARFHELAPGFRKFPQINVSVHTGQRVRKQPNEIPGLPDLITRTQSQIPDLTHPIECRPASTEPVYRIMIEARTTPIPDLARHALRLAEYIQRHLECLGFPIEILDCVNGGQVIPQSLSSSP